MSRVTRNLMSALRRIDARNPYFFPRIADCLVTALAAVIFAFVIFVYLVPA